MSIPLAIKAALIAAGFFALSPPAKAQTDPKGKTPLGKLLIKVLFKRVQSLKLGGMQLIYNITVNNPGTQPQTFTQAYLLLQISADNGMNWSNIGASDSKIAKIDIPAGNNKPLAQEIPILINLTASLSSMLNKSNKYRLVFKYTHGGVESQSVQSYDFTQALQKIPGFSGIEHVHHTPNSGTKRAIIRTVIIQIKQIYPYAFTTPRQGQAPGTVPPKTFKHHRASPQVWHKATFHKPVYHTKPLTQPAPNKINTPLFPAKLRQVLVPGVGDASPLV